NTTAGAVRSAAELGVWMVNVHASGGRRMMEACREVLNKRTGQRPLLTAVTVLTSLEQEDLHEVGIDIEPMVQVQRLARLTQECGLDGVVCSAREAKALRNTLGDDLQLVTPGIRPADASADDQKRILTPAQAMENGSTYLVTGRPITSAPAPARALDAILQSLWLGSPCFCLPPGLAPATWRLAGLRSSGGSTAIAPRRAETASGTSAAAWGRAAARSIPDC